MNIRTTIALAIVIALSACKTEATSDQRMAAQQEKALQDGVSSVGMPAIKNWREKRLLKMIYELRDQDGLRTYTYVVAQQTGARVFLCDSIGFPINDATGFSSPEKVYTSGGGSHSFPMIQAEPNGLFTPDASNSYWVMCLDTEKGKPAPTFITGYPLVTTFPLK